ncbi:LysR family transcriptional regulator [Bradyrhizobium iriomotense]|uniref:LysR family transcriptional regulator n=1 Tax=Bradyrhizobium iriomotense TaxID=441950 RepID=UPI001B8A1B35|nr:LysR family transcriptional regulator [Bradyrhizobium iriomotense]MBR0784853.1 LysR family transcriptional regulator [Bradyrhizobium iriomotense]
MLHSRLLNYIDEVARTGSIRKAADRLNVAASAISRQILALETQLGTPIFQRLPKKLILTAAGEVLIGHVRQTLKELTRTQVKIEELKGLRRGEITLAMMSGLASNLVPNKVKEFRAANPRVKLNLTLFNTGAEIQVAVASGEADLGIGFDFGKDSNLKVLARAVGRLGAVMTPNHPLAKRSNVRLSDCIDYPLVIADSTSAIRPYLEAAFARVAIDLQPAIETNSIEIMRHAVILNDGITFLTPFDVESERRAGRLTYVPVRELAQDAQALMLIGHVRGTSAIASVLAELLKAMIREVTS